MQHPLHIQPASEKRLIARAKREIAFERENGKKANLPRRKHSYGEGVRLALNRSTARMSRADRNYAKALRRKEG